MSRPLFSIGELVELQSKNTPQYNGDYIVKSIYPKGSHRIKSDEVLNVSKAPFGYDLGFNVPEATISITVWSEHALRKKHKPSEFGSYDQLMKNLSSPVKYTS